MLGMWEKYQVKINYKNKIMGGLDLKNYADIDGIFISRDKIHLFRDRGPAITENADNIKNIEIDIR